MNLTKAGLEEDEILGSRENILKEHILNLYDKAAPVYQLGVEEDSGKTWVNGQPVYRQTFSMTNPGTGDIVLPHGIDGLDLIVASIEGYCILANGTKITLPVINHASGGGGGGGGGNSGDAANTITLVQWNATDLVGYIGTNYVTTVAVSELTFTIAYTKVIS